MDHVLVFNERHARRLLAEYLTYYHEDRTHYTLAKEPPVCRSVAERPSQQSKVVGIPRVGGPYDSELETFLASRHLPYRVEKPQSTGWRTRLHQLEAVERWYRHGWSKLDARLRSSITERIVVFLSLFDHNPAVQAAFCPPRSAYAGMLKPSDPTPLPPIEESRNPRRLPPNCHRKN